MSCLLGILAIMVFEPMSVIPYWMRTIRIYVIFKAQEHYFRYKQKPDSTWFKSIKEPLMFKISIIFIAVLFLLCLLLFGLSFIPGLNANYIYLPSYSIYMCFMNGICNPEKSMRVSLEHHVNITILWLLVINLFGNFFFVTCIFKLRNIRNEFNIRKEMLLTFLAWFTTTQLAIGLFIAHASSAPNFDWVYLILVVRSILAVLLTALRPLYLSYTVKNPDYFMLLPPSYESIQNLDMVLQIPLATDYFYDFLESTGEPSVTYLFSLYVDIRKYDKAV